MTTQTNIVDQILDWESGEMSTEVEAAFFQNLMDEGILYGLQGMYGRRAQELLDTGMIIEKPTKHNRFDVV